MGRKLDIIPLFTNMDRNKRLYVCANVCEFAKFERYQKKEYATCSWSAIELDADLFKDYKDAYNHAKRINKFYGFNRCSVMKLTADQFNGYYWQQLLDAERERDRSWWRQDYARHEFAGLKW